MVSYTKDDAIRMFEIGLGILNGTATAEEHAEYLYFIEKIAPTAAKVKDNLRRMVGASGADIDLGEGWICSVTGREHYELDNAKFKAQHPAQYQSIINEKIKELERKTEEIDVSINDLIKRKLWVDPDCLSVSLYNNAPITLKQKVDE